MLISIAGLEGLSKESEPVHITEKTGYVETPIPKKCATCEYSQGELCLNDEVQEDDEVPTDKKTGYKLIDAEDGCCDEWEPKEEKKQRVVEL